MNKLIQTKKLIKYHYLSNNCLLVVVKKLVIEIFIAKKKRDNSLFV